MGFCLIWLGFRTLRCLLAVQGLPLQALPRQSFHIGGSLPFARLFPPVRLPSFPEQPFF